MCAFLACFNLFLGVHCSSIEAMPPGGCRMSGAAPAAGYAINSAEASVSALAIRSLSRLRCRVVFFRLPCLYILPGAISVRPGLDRPRIPALYPPPMSDATILPPAASVAGCPAGGRLLPNSYARSPLGGTVDATRVALPFDGESPATSSG